MLVTFSIIVCKIPCNISNNGNQTSINSLKTMEMLPYIPDTMQVSKQWSDCTLNFLKSSEKLIWKRHLPLTSHILLYDRVNNRAVSWKSA